MHFNLDWQIMVLGTEEETCEVKPLSMDAYQKVMAYTQANQMDTNQDPAAAFKGAGSNKMKSLLEEVIPTHVRNIKGITFQFDNETKELTPTDLIAHDMFVIINMQIIGKIFNISSLAGADQPGEDKEEDSEPQNPEQTDSKEQ